MPHNSARFQADLAAAVRQGGGGSFNPQRLAVYTRLVRNNIFGFINRCFTETPRYCSRQEWAELLEAFVREGKAHSPYFQDIAPAFYRFCREGGRLPEHLLALMDLEQTQLLAETAPYPAAATKQSGEMTLSPAAFLREYPETFLNRFPKGTLAAAGNMLVWRDPADRVLWYKLNPIDHILLGTVSLQAHTETALLDGLAELMPPQDDTWRSHISGRWRHWTEQGVLCHA